MITVLYVDDEPSLLEIATLFLEKTGEFSVDTALSASEGLEKLHQAQYDVIISDYQMPGMDGIEFLRALRAEGNKTPFIIYTGKGREEVVIEALNSGAEFYLQKGGDPTAQFAELQSKIRQATLRYRAEESVIYLNRVNSLLSHVNKNIVRISSRDELFKAICSVAIENGKFRMAWVGVIDKNTRMITPVAYEGSGAKEYLRTITISVEDIPEGRGPSGRAAREGSFAVSNDIPHDPLMQPWRESAEKYGYLSSGAFPIRCRGEVIGVLSLYAAEKVFFSDEEVNLLEEVAADISFALDKLELDYERLISVEALRQSEETYSRLAAIVESSDDAIIGKTLGGVITSWNKGAEKIYGYTAREIIGKSIAVLIPPDRSDELPGILEKIGLGEHFDHYVTPRIRKDGRQIQMSLTISPIRDAKGIIIGASTIARDITEQKEAQERLNQQLLFLQQLIDTIPNPVFYKDTNGVYTGCNRAFEVYIGLTRDQIIGKSVYQIAPKELADKYYTSDRELFDHPGTLMYEAQVKYADGSIHDVIFNKATFSDLQGTPRGIVGIILDITGRKRAEEQLRQNRQLLASAMDLAQIVSWEYDVATGMFTFDDRFFAFHGTTAEREGGHQMSAETYAREFVYPDDIPAVSLEISRNLNTTDPGYVSQIEHRIIRRDGAVRTIIARYARVLGAGGSVIKTYGANQDITERRQADERIRQAEEKYRDIFENALEGIYQITTKGKLQTANPAMARILGYESVDDLITTITDTARQLWVHQEERKDYLRQLREHDSVQDFECEFYRKDKSQIWVSLTTHTVRGTDGKIQISEGIIVDITRRKRDERELIDRESEYRTILRTAMDGFSIISPDGRFLDVNDAFCRLTGYSPDELFVRSLSDIEAKETADVISEHSREIIRKGEDRFETRYRRKDGSLIDVEVSVVATDRHGGQFVTFHHDITERIRAHEALISARNELEQKVFERTRELKATNESLQAEIVLRNKAENDIVTSLKEKEMLLKEIHHRVKNNMQVISSLLFMQARAQKDETIKGILQESQDRIKSIALVHEKLYQSTDLDRIDYTDYLRKITEHLFESYKIDPTIVKLHLNAEKAVLHIDKAVPCSLIINELISNSLKHAFPGGRKGVITIDFRKGVDNYILTYSDDGIGIPEGITFDRTDSMGMQLIKGLTKQINGSIALDRTVGTKYTITFPA